MPRWSVQTDCAARPVEKGGPERTREVLPPEMAVAWTAALNVGNDAFDAVGRVGPRKIFPSTTSTPSYLYKQEKTITQSTIDPNRLDMLIPPHHPLHSPFSRSVYQLSYS